MKILGKHFAMAAAALFVAQPVQAEMGCWNHEQASAAKVRDLQSRLMVASLRCRAMGHDVLPSYNSFINVNRATLQAANGVIKEQFATGYGSEGENAYDRFTTAMANEYGADATNAEICDETAAAAMEAVAAEGDPRKLIGLADRLGSAPELPGGECPIVFSSR